MKCSLARQDFFYTLMKICSSLGLSYFYLNESCTWPTKFSVCLSEYTGIKMWLQASKGSAIHIRYMI